MQPHEPIVGLLGLLHGASVTELRSLRVDDVDLAVATATLGRRPHPTRLDPATATALRRCLHHRDDTGPWLLVNQKSKTVGKQVAVDYLAMALPPAQVTAQKLRATRLAQLVSTMDPVLVAAVSASAAEPSCTTSPTVSTRHACLTVGHQAPPDTGSAKPVRFRQRIGLRRCLAAAGLREARHPA